MVNKKLGDIVITPNGKGYIHGFMWENGVQYVLIRHNRDDLIGSEFGERLTPIDYPTTLWRYEFDLIFGEGE